MTKQIKPLKQMEMFDLISVEGLTPNQYYLLCCMKDSVTPLRMNMHLELRYLTSEGWINYEHGQYTLATKAYPLIQKVESYFKLQKKKTSNQLMGTDFGKNIDTYREIFPAKKLPSGKFARVSPSNLENAFRWFFEHHDYSWDLIFQATERYVNEFRMKNWMYMRTSQYFIRKQEPDKTFSSELANYCDLVMSGDDYEEPTEFDTKVV